MVELYVLLVSIFFDGTPIANQWRQPFFYRVCVNEGYLYMDFFDIALFYQNMSSSG